MEKDNDEKEIDAENFAVLARLKSNQRKDYLKVNMNVGHHIQTTYTLRAFAQANCQDGNSTEWGYPATSTVYLNILYFVLIFNWQR